MSATIPRHTCERVRIPVEGLRLEGALSYPDAATGERLAVLVNPHPCLGGDMENNVILALEAESLRHGFTTLRFNFRGVGESEGTEPLEQRVAAFWENPAIVPDRETATHDLHAAIDFAMSAVGGSLRTFLLLGYSFGGVIAMLEAARRWDVSGMAMISPPVHQLVGGLPPLPGCMVAVIRGGEDIGVDETGHGNLIAHLGSAASVLEYPETDHFYRGIESQLARDVLSALLGGSSH